MERAGASLSASVLPWLRANIGALSNQASDDILAAIRALYDCSM